jgi:hypothetical protein
MKTLMSIALLLLAVNICSAEELQHSNLEREWQFPLAQGTVKIELSGMISPIDGREVYTLQIIDGIVEPNVTSEAKFLETVVHEMEKEGMSPQRIDMILLELREPDIRKRLHRAAYASKMWKQAERSDRERVVVNLLNSIGAYSAFDRVLNQYGLKVKVGWAEYLSMIKPAEVGLKGGTVSALPDTATLEIGVREATKGVQRGQP